MSVDQATERMSADDMEAMSLQVRTAYRARDPEAMAALYSPDAVFWHSNDNLAISVDRHIETFIYNAREMTEFHYVDIRLDATEDGYVQRHRAHGTMKSGGTFSLHACVFYTVQDGLITRADEYWDVGPLRAAGAEPVH